MYFSIASDTTFLANLINAATPSCLFIYYILCSLCYLKNSPLWGVYGFIAINFRFNPCHVKSYFLLKILKSWNMYKISPYWYKIYIQIAAKILGPEEKCAKFQVTRVPSYIAKELCNYWLSDITCEYSQVHMPNVFKKDLSR